MKIKSIAFFCFQLDASISPEEAIIKALVSNTLREAAVEVSSEAEINRKQMEKVAALPSPERTAPDKQDIDEGIG